MSEKPASTVDWFRLSIEGLVIVVSILLAFALDAWSDQREEAQTEHEMLIALQSELQGAQEQLLLNIDLHERQADSTLKLALRMQSAGAGATLNVRDYDLGVFLTSPPTTLHLVSRALYFHPDKPPYSVIHRSGPLWNDGRLL